MKSKLIIAIGATFLMFLACGEEKKEAKASEEQTQMEYVMEIHDQVMPKMSTIGKLVSELKPKADSTEQGMKYGRAMADLQDSYKAMMDWMQGFGERFDSDEILNGKELSEQKQMWLAEEEEKVKKLRDQINGSIERAEKLLEEGN